MDGEDSERIVAFGSDVDGAATLTSRELDVLRLVADGLTNGEVAERLFLSDKTVKSHVSHILTKLRLSHRTQAAVWAVRAGVVSVPT